ncbi:hypothetical protein N7466_011530 [Penicillium verhagenii]|uniref:uncharacterized protein n=1 Tax=Penicillium verhagenii TaxID=1562060 RepID=UPI0025457FFE|nr:uncharacterized protein N7466_011530 [Penicillium verhagenii]KAJ5915597.1 hypothetical protein N7466_011530 [Penicillium verhagenii]
MQNDLPNPLFDKVFIGTEFGTESDQPRSTGYKVHPFPTILALGIVLIELELGEDLADIQDEHSFASIKHKPYYVAQYLLKEVMKRFNLDSGLLRAAKFCIDRASFAHFEPLSTDTLLLNQDFVDTYYNSIVRPLEQDLVKGAFWTWEQVDQLTPPSLVQTGICKVFTKNPVRKRHGETLGFNTRRVLNGDQTAVAMSSLKESKDVILQSLKSSAHLHPAIGRTKTSEKPRSKLSECENAQSQPAHGGKQIISEGCSLSTEPERLPVTKKNRHSRPRSRDDFEVAIICALPREASAVHAHFEKHWEDDGGIYTYGKQHNDKNSYSVGSIGGHNVVLAHQERMGPVPAAKVATMCSMSFTNIKLALVVGICGGVPSPTPNEEILLGDVVISKGIVHYTFGRQDSDQFRRKATVEDQPGRPSGEILSLLVRLETDMHRRTLQTTIAGYLDDLDYGAHGTTKICYPGNGQDKLFEAKYCHRHQDESTICPTCVDGICDIARKSGCEKLKCDQQRLVRRSRQNQKNRPLVHFGLIASGETVLKSGIKREAIADEAKVIAFEMEGAGVWDSIPCVVIKGVCDYADSHKNKIWQDYAAMTAAASAKAFLQHWPTNTTLESEGLH